MTQRLATDDAAQRPAAPPIFVLGCPRSGTTVLGTSIQRHPSVHGGAETHFFIPALQAFDEIWRYSAERLPADLNWLNAERISKEGFLRHYASGLKALVEARGAGRWLDHTGGNVLVWDKLQMIFPEAQFVFTVRDGRNVVESVMHSFFGGSFSFRKATEMWVEHNQAGLEALEGANPGRGLLVTYESLIDAPAATLKDVLRFLRLPWVDGVAAPYVSEPLANSSFEGETAADKRKPRWHRWERWKREEFEQIAGATLRRFGYEQDERWVDR